MVVCQWDVGQYLRDLYYKGSFIYSDVPYGDEEDYMDEKYAEQVARRTDGKSRTPYGAEVFVYGPDYEAADDHDFEVEIPRAQLDLRVPYDEYGTGPNEESKRSFDKNEKIVATVQGDNRLAIPRTAFDSFMQKTGKRVSLGDKVYIKVDENTKKISVRFDLDPNAKSYDLTRDRGRVKYKPENDLSWSFGEKFEIDVINEGLEIDISEDISAKVR